VRVVAGTARGRRLKAPAGTKTRPTSDRVREAVFASLVSMDAVEEAHVADLFAGTGAMGLEALSRGAASVVFVEQDRAAVTTIRDNLEASGFAAADVSVVQADVMRWAERGAPVDLAIIDPPYAFDQWPALLGRLQARLVVCESGGQLDLGDDWDVLREKRYGTTVVTVAQRRTTQPTSAFDEGA
jgi:16S rRNA (guanine966-N2)-methyltransferase